MNDMSATITPKSDQINADDLIAGPRTITIRDVKIAPGTEQPVAVYFQGDDGKPYLPCKSMRRVMVAAWGPDASVYTGRAMTLFRDPSVTWGGMEVGSIRISHMSHIESKTVVVLTATKKARKPFTVLPLVVTEEKPRRTFASVLEEVKRLLAAAATDADIEAVMTSKDAQLLSTKESAAAELGAAFKAAMARVKPTPDEEFPA